MKHVIGWFCVLLICISTQVFAQTEEENLPSKDALLSVAEDEWVIGDRNAPVTIIEYASLSCSHCASFHNNVYKELKTRYVDTGKVRFVFRDFPLDETALRASLMVRCKGEESFSSFVDAVFMSQSNWVGRKNYLEVLSNIGKLGGLTGEAFDQCTQDQVAEANVIKTKYEAFKVLNVRSTPTFFINGSQHSGLRDIDTLAKIIDPLLSESVDNDN